MKGLLSAFFLSLISLTGFAHGYHVSIAQVDYNAETKSLEISLKLITEDIEFVIEGQGAERLNLGEENELVKADEYIKEYILKNFLLSVNDHPTSMEYLGKEVEDGSTWCYIEIKNVGEAISSVGIKNTIFIEAFHNEANRVNLNIKGKQNSFVFSPGFTEDKATY